MDDLIKMCSAQYAPLVGLLGLYCGDRDVAEDLAQEALVRLCRDWRKVRRLDAPEQWLRRVAINLAHSHYRRRSAEQQKLASLGRQGEPVLLESDIETLELLKKLPHREKTALLLHYYADLTVRQVADQMDIPEGTVKTLIHRAARRLGSDPGIQEARLV
ncbi:MAG: sigma-70 family RNA polymerase sigma factor [Actinomycetota bacterium]|nr:sigma-70 family RNA polymerase sigma factor [Actinomycetota bacterium]